MSYTLEEVIETVRGGESELRELTKCEVEGCVLPAVILYERLGYPEDYCVYILCEYHKEVVIKLVEWLMKGKPI